MKNELFSFFVSVEMRVEKEKKNEKLPLMNNLCF